MAPRKETHGHDLRLWLLKLEKLIGKPIVVSFIVEHGQINYYHSVDMRRYFEIDDEGDDERPSKLPRLPKLDSRPNYWG